MPVSLTNLTTQQEYQVKFLTFPGGERHCAIQNADAIASMHERNSVVSVNCDFRNSDDIIDLLLVTDAIRNLIAPRPELVLCLTYIPFARQDRRVNPGEAHALKVFASLVNSLNFKYVYVADPHSDVCEAVFNNLVVLPQWELAEFFCKTVIGRYPTHILAPDVGAVKKAQKLAQNLGVPLLLANKRRDLKTGAIVGFELLDDPHQVKENDHVLVVDDICDGGGTFLPIPQLFPNCPYVSLYVTHGIFSKGITDLFKVYDSIGTYNLMNDSIEIEFTKIGEFYYVV